MVVASVSEVWYGLLETSYDVTQCSLKMKFEFLVSNFLSIQVNANFGRVFHVLDF